MRSAFAAIFCLPLVLTGCALSGSNAPTVDRGLAIEGIARGGQQPIVGAHVYLFAAGTDSYGGPSVSLLHSGGNTAKDSSGGATNNDYYVTTGAGGIFNITGDYSCTPDTQVYLYILGGNPGFGANTGAALLAALGDCPSGGNFLTQVPFISANEVTTIAAAYAFAGFAIDPTHVGSSGTPLALTGIKNAFANAANLADLGSGAALATTPSGNGIAPQATVYSLGNILASCINSNGAITGPTTPSACYTLFTNATSDGTSTGTQPSDTAAAAINIAHHPGVNIDALYGLITGIAPFGAGLTAEPNDFTVGVQFNGGGLNAPNFVAVDGSGNAWFTNSGASVVSELSGTGAALSPAGGFTGGGMDGLEGIAVDLAGNVWIANDHTSGGSVIKLSTTGTVLSGSNGFTVGGLTSPFGIAIDGSGNAWVSNSGDNSVSELSGIGTAVSGSNGYTGGALNGPLGIAIDSTGNAWVANNGASSVTEFSSAAAVLSGINGYTGGGLSSPYDIAIDHAGNAWAANASNATVTKLSSNGSVLSGFGGYSGGGLNNPFAVAIDGLGNAWIANLEGGGVTEISNSGSIVSGSNGYTNAGMDLPDSVAIDGSGNVWVANLQGPGVTEIIGAAAPVVTPLATGAKTNTLGVRP